MASNSLSGDAYDLTQTAKIILGKRYQKFLQLIIPVYNMVSNIPYFIMIFMCLNDFLAAFEYSCSNLYLFILLLYIFLPVSLVQDLSRLSYLSYFGMACFMFIIVCMLGNSVRILMLSSEPVDFHLNAFQLNFKELPRFFGVILFTYDINGVLGSVRQQMSNSKQRFRSVLISYMTVLYVISASLGLICSSAYGSETKQIIFFNLQTQSSYHYKLSKLIDVLYSISLFSGIMIYNYPCFKQFDKKTFAWLGMKNQPGANGNLCKEFGVQLLNRVFVYAVEAGIGILFYNVAKTMNVLGCIFCIILGYIYPYLLYNKVFGYKISKLEKMTNIGVLLFGLISAVLGIASTVSSI